MPKSISRLEYLRENPTANAWAIFDEATNLSLDVAHKHVMPPPGSINDKQVVIIGSGVGGLTTAYELLHHNPRVKVTILEARDRTGGRCMTLRTGDTLVEDKNSDLHSSRGETQVVRFDRPVGDSEPYLNAGPGRIPSSHKLLLEYLRRFGVEIEVYVMNSSSNLTQIETDPVDGRPIKSQPIVNRRLEHNTRGWIAEMVFKNADKLLENRAGCEKHADKLRSLMVTFGELTACGDYISKTSPQKQDDDNECDKDEREPTRAGFVELPGVEPGKVADALGLGYLLESEYWKKTSFYQPSDFLWQPTLFQPVGGMDQVQHAFAQQVSALGGTIHLNSPVIHIDYDQSRGKFVIEANGHEEPFLADYCFSNIAIPFLENILSDNLQGLDQEAGFSPAFKQALHAIYQTQADTNETKRFLACTTKVGWQADRTLWQGKPHDASPDNTDGSELGVVPIYGGISWTSHPITQIWYPSDAYHDQRGVLTGAYNFSDDARDFGHMSVDERLAKARCGAALFDENFARGLENGITVAWQNMAYIKGGWAQWVYVDDCTKHYNAIIQGTGVNDTNNKEPQFFIVGDQVSSLPGWQEGAVVSALNAITRLAQPDRQLPYLKTLPDTRLMVEGL